MLTDSVGEIQRGLEVVEFAIGVTHLLKGKVAENVGFNVDSMSVRQPLGVAAGINVDVSRRSGLRQLFRSETVGAGSVGVAVAGRVAHGSRAARRGVQCCPGRQAGGRTRCSRIPTSTR